MKLKLLLIVTVVFLSPTVNADDNFHWVIGSFISITNAENRIARVQQELGLDSYYVEATVHGRDVFRIITEKPGSISDQDQTKAALAAIGIQGVWNLLPGADDLTMIDGALAATAPATTGCVQAAEPTIVSEETSFASGKQSYIDFCINKATAAERRQHCGNEEFSEQSRKELMRNLAVDEKYLALMDYCMNRATGDERKLQCGNAGLLARINKKGELPLLSSY